MEQRPLRLGDICDDYCTRERRVTNHVIVALVEDAIRQTRCTTCDTEHAYKGAKEPRLRKKTETSEAYAQVLSSVAGSAVQEPAAAVPGDDAAMDASAGTDGQEPEPEPPPGAPDGWLAHRRLIRATLPRTENEPPPPRPIPEFTMHQRQPQPRGGRGFRFRGPGPSGDSGNGNGPGPGGFGHGRPGNTSGRPGRHRGKKRSR